ncbi:GDSL-type esterase/lipase family protein [Gorillibacterium massiliense]|uniref:GDSL-type esterase/lipase family protein n=1 Tax=Gorillibacterium massiliense TaxID=1280390 RepID=UPI0004BBA6A2|nr:GDSL-type esterase/lipase family protein [Gorillibacterium massiliense]
MRSTRIVWRIVGITALIATIFFLAGFGYAIRNVLVPASVEASATPLPTPSSNPIAAKDGKSINLLAIGDSLTKGIGDTEGKGYVSRVKDTLAQTTKKNVYLWNYAVSGSKTEDLLDSLDKKDGDLPRFVQEADVVLFTIGGNDLFQSGVDVNELFNESGQLNIDGDLLTLELPSALERLDRIITRLAELNPRAKIVYVMFYYPFSDIDVKREGPTFVQEWYNGAFGFANRYPNVIIVPTYDLFSQNPLIYLFTDHYHPNSAGYARIAERVLQALD